MASDALRPELAAVPAPHVAPHVASGAATAAATARSRGGARVASSLPSFSGLVTLLLVSLVVVAVSVPRLRGFALRENELDAIHTARLFAAVLPAALPDEAAAPAIEALVTQNGLARQLSDAEFLSGGRLMRRHGYLFEVTRVPVGGGDGADAAPGELCVRAWPWEPGRTGVAAFVGRAGGEVLGHPNEGRWSALFGPPERVGEAWQRLR